MNYIIQVYDEREDKWFDLCSHNIYTVIKPLYEDLQKANVRKKIRLVKAGG